MTPAKGQGSSRRKGKKIASNDLATKVIVKEAPHSESEHSDEEEGHRNPGSECAPLIDPWYDTHTHFPKVSGEYVPPPPSHVWLSLYCRNTEIS